MAHNGSNSDTPRFQPGARVRVRSGVMDPNFPDIPLGGWAGTIEESEQGEGEAVYLIEWDRRTLDCMHFIYRNRCERDGLQVESMWLGDGALEADDGKMAPIEQPTEIRTPPLSEKDQDDRVRKAMGLTHDDPVPEISHEALSAYSRYLAAQLKFPFAAIRGEVEIGPYSRKRATMTVTGLLGPDESGGLSVEDGLVCTGRDGEEEIEFPLCDIEVKTKDPNFRLVSDY